MSSSTVAIVGSGIVGTAIAYQLTKMGHDVAIFEKGPDYPYPHSKQFTEKIVNLYQNPAYSLPKDIKNLTKSGDYKHNPDRERFMVVGGTASQWTAITPRFLPSDLKTNSLYGYGEDWPISYDDLEPYYCKAESYLGVSGTTKDNPFAPWRSKPYPLPPFELSYEDQVLAERLRTQGLVLHTTPQARTRESYEQRPGCMNYGVCEVCPIGARYSPNYHLQKAMATGLVTLHTNTSVRRIGVDSSGFAHSLSYQGNDDSTEQEHSAKVVIVAAGALESARLLLLSDGQGNSSGHVGQHLTFHHVWEGELIFNEVVRYNMLGPVTGQSDQFRDPQTRGRHGGLKVILPSGQASISSRDFNSGPEIVESAREIWHSRTIEMASESLDSPNKFVALSDERDRFGDSFAHVHYESSEFDHNTYEFAHGIFNQFANALSPEEANLDRVENFNSGHHHMGTCRMGDNERNSVVDQFGKVHNTTNLFVIGGSNFVSTSAANPTLTMVALALRASDYLIDQII